MKQFTAEKEDNIGNRGCNKHQMSYDLWPIPILQIKNDSFDVWIAWDDL